ncbi:hypothetical protein CDD83_524 [Cordyceps sp. RAO-2017]|nr:hypothetical protein CDD83_524 [Cordyceps sp. RAO-2017]
MPRTTKSGFQRSLSEREFAYTKCKNVVCAYVLLDLTSTLMAKDGYFAVGPDQPHQLPRYLRCLPPCLLLVYREVLSLVACLSHILSENSLIDLLQHWTLSTLFPSRSGLWMHASTFGSFSQVLDRGLSGWWGAFWHQTFRVPFHAPVRFLMREGYIEAGTAAADVVSIWVTFLQSGLLHASGSLSSISKTKPWRPLQFFLLQALGILVQRAASRVVRRPLKPLSRQLRRGVNLAFALVWLYLTVGLYFDDVASAGLWTLQPVRVSLFRGLGLGSADERWPLWDHEIFARRHDH